ncbi:MAG: branched-chain amino acid ABC transporter permease [Zavarzinia sp.]|nr:branched-chain amino acid ABC transporter permease [Zavarzinia sp.]
MNALFDPRPGRHVALALICAALWLGLPLVVAQPYVLHVMILIAIYSTFAIGWNLVTGFVGLKTFGHHALFALAAYGSALLSKGFGLSPWITMWAGALLATVIGLLVALPALRIRSVAHVAIVTLAFAEIVRITLSNLKDITRGEMGLVGIPPFDPVHLPYLGKIAFSGSMRLPFFYLASLVTIGAFLAVYGLMRSRVGLAFVALRNSQDAAESLGLNLARYKFLAFGISAFIVGLAGVLYAHYIRVLTPHSVAGMDVMILVIAMVLVGGIGTHAGPLVGAVALIGVAEALRGIGEYRLLTYGALIILVTLFHPKGLVSLATRAAATLAARRGERTEAA